MRIRKVLIELKVEEKINKKHGVYREEIENSLFEGKPLFYKSRKNKYMAITLRKRYITIIFIYNNMVATIITSYPSSDWQIKLYRRRKLK